MTRSLLFAMLLCCAGCPTPRATPQGGPGSRGASFDYRTMRAVHRVQLELGESRRLGCTGVIAVQRPDRFRLAALGPASVRLFELLYRRGEVIVLAAGPGLGDTPAALLRSVGRDIGALYRLAPHAAGAPDADRTITYGDHERHGPYIVPRTLTISRKRPYPYRVSIRVERVALDVTLDPRLFQRP